MESTPCVHLEYWSSLQRERKRERDQFSSWKLCLTLTSKSRRQPETGRDARKWSRYCVSSNSIECLGDGLRMERRRNGSRSNLRLNENRYLLSVSSYSPCRKKKKKKYRKNEVKLEKMFKTQKGIGKEGRKEICPDLLITISRFFSLSLCFEHLTASNWKNWAPTKRRYR